MRKCSNAAPGLPAEKNVDTGSGRSNSGYLENGIVNVSQRQALTGKAKVFHTLGTHKTFSILVNH